MTDENQRDGWIMAHEFMEDSQSLPLSEVLRLCAVDMTQLRQIVDESVVTPMRTDATEWEFSSTMIVRIKRVARLQSELDLNAHAAAIVLDLLDEVQRLRRGLQ